MSTYESATNQIDISDLDYGSDYYWRVKSNNICGSSDYSSVYKFTTQCSDGNEITISEITVDGATISWSNPNGSSVFEILVVPQGTPPVGVFQTVNTNSYNLTGLNSYSDYDFYVRASCSNGVFSALSNASFSTLINFCVDGIFFDSGGPSDDYSNGENYTTTITPSNPGEKASVTFTSFSLENQADKLRIYDGPNTTYPFIGQQYGFTGNNNPGTITSTDATGALTFAFYSDGINTSAGWTATVNCAVLGISNFSQDQLSYYPNPANEKVSFSSPRQIKSISIYNVLGQLVQEQIADAKQLVVDISLLSAGQYVFKVATDSTVSTVKIIKTN
ncbi:MAG: T9SS type A sorting domain-containing protein [Flavobacterium sp.]|nr:T9SS type A sorting domain-containing protein [Flavobacterium sp.]